ncbi:unnamed protein product [Oikopleura dioica]|uniref:Uncharacterized protein n=1 Tax=Oikopleura dioica TaxID=34765 RepID=E4YDT4_OIKDI|nr:unnamed protein product [Oikopleura dioica]
MQQIASYTSFSLSAGEAEKNEEDSKEKKDEPSKLGTLMGVYLPCVQNIFGVILFIRMPWIVGLAGIWEGLGLIFFCCLTTMLTAISMSAIATNGRVPAGGSYYMISRSLGPGWGGAVGMMFYFGTTIAAAMYIIGSIEIVTLYMGVGRIFEIEGDSFLGSTLGISGMFDNFRIWGTLLLIIMCGIVLAGMKYVNKSAMPFLICVIVSILALFIGFFASAAGPNMSTVMCMVGDTVAKRPRDGLCYKFLEDMPNFVETNFYDKTQCSGVSCSLDTNVAGNTNTHFYETKCHFHGNAWKCKTPTELFKNFCKAASADSYDMANFDPASPYANCRYEALLAAPAWSRHGVPGLAKSISDGVYSEETWNWQSQHYREDKGRINIPQLLTGPFPYVTSTPTSGSGFTTTMILIGVFFPSVTGIMAGSNRSGDLANGSKSIPFGTTGAILTTGITYLASALLIGLTSDGALMRDKFGDSLYNGDGNQILMNASVTWPHPWVMLIGSLLSSIGAGLQSLTGAPRLLQAIAKDDVIPKFDMFAKGRGELNEPTIAIIPTFIICLIAIWIAEIEAITPILSIFFLMCYLFVNLSTTVNSLMNLPMWRPTFKYYHWTVSLLGCFCCLTMMFITNYIAAIGILLLACAIYVCVTVFGGQKEWGDSITGLYTTLAISAMRQLNQHMSSHTKSWRPQVLVFNKLVEDDGSTTVKYPKLLEFVASLKEGKGLMIIKTLIQGEYEQYEDKKEKIEQEIREQLRAKNILPLECSVAVSPKIADDVPLICQCSGISGLKPNCIVLNFPTVSPSRKDYSFFYNTARHAAQTDCALIVSKNIDEFPDQKDAMQGHIDVWWIRQDGGMSLLLASLIRRVPTWKKTSLRVYITADPSDNSEAMRKALVEYLLDMRIQAEVNIVEVECEDTDAYLTPERKNSVCEDKGVDNVVNLARKSVAVAWTPEQKASFDGLPTSSSSGTWSGKHAGISKPKPRATVMRKIHEATGLNRLIQQYSGESDLVFINMPPFPIEHNEERERNYMRFIESLTKNIPRTILVRTTGKEVITAFN